MATKGQIHLGDDVRDEITTFEGVVIGITDYINGCQRMTVQPRGLRDGKSIEAEVVDIEQLSITACPHAEAPDPAPHGGPRGRRPEQARYGTGRAR